MYSLDVSYSWSDYWQLTGWASNNTVRSNQGSCGAIGRNAYCGQANGAWVQWDAALEESSKGRGMGLRGSPSKRIKVGADYYLAQERNGFNVTRMAGSPANNPTNLPDGLPPEILYKTSSLVAFMEYVLSAQESWRVDAQTHRVQTDDWTWDLNSFYVDGSVVNLPKRSRAEYIGVSYLYRWR